MLVMEVFGCESVGMLMKFVWRSLRVREVCCDGVGVCLVVWVGELSFGKVA